MLPPSGAMQRPFGELFGAPVPHLRLAPRPDAVDHAGVRVPFSGLAHVQITLIVECPRSSAHGTARRPCRSNRPKRLPVLRYLHDGAVPGVAGIDVVARVECQAQKEAAGIGDLDRLPLFRCLSCIAVRPLRPHRHSRQVPRLSPRGGPGHLPSTDTCVSLSRMLIDSPRGGHSLSTMKPLLRKAPSMGMAAPLIWAALSLHRNITRSATSSGYASRRAGILFRRCSLRAGSRS